jgi:hypothetical protein
MSSVSHHVTVGWFCSSPTLQSEHVSAELKLVLTKRVSAISCNVLLYVYLILFLTGSCQYNALFVVTVAYL